MRASRYLLGLAMLAGIVGLIAVDGYRSRGARVADARPLGIPGGPGTTDAELRETVARMRARVRASARDTGAASTLADALMRLTRVTGKPALVGEGEQALLRVLHDDPLQYDARRMLAAVYLSEHRFREAIREAERARDAQPRDDWNYGVIGDGHVELGEYDEAFAAFQSMMDLRPGAAAYARAAYAYELRGQLGAALAAMKMSTDATTPHDPESLAWHHAQLGELYWQMGRLNEAAFEYEWADHAFPGHPFARAGLARVKQSAGDLPAAIAIAERVMSDAPTPDVAERLGDMYAAVGRAAEAARQYAIAEDGYRTLPAQLARFLVDHDRRPHDAVALAEAAAAERHDIFTEDALAWCYFKVGRVADAARAMQRARRTGSRDRTILAHAAAIAAAADSLRARDSR